METTSFWQRLRQRKIVQWAVAYLAAGLALLEGINILEQTYAWTPVFPRVAIALVGVGFLVTLVVAWFHGERGSQSVPFVEVILLAFLTFVGAGAAWWAGSTAPTMQTADGATSPGTLLTAFDPGTATNSVAVLPFLNMSGSPANDYLADGVTEDVIAELGSIAGLRVISRTSVMRYRNTDKDIPTIGRELGVGTILEGSLRVVGNQVRIVVQLIDVATDGHLWTGTYDGKMEEIFALQTRVARDVADALNARLLPGVLADAASPRTVNPDAWRHYAQGRELSSASDAASLRLARMHLDSAILLDPEFAKAYEALAEFETPIAFEMLPPPAPQPPAETGRTTTTAISAAEKALELNPRLAGAQSAWAVQSAMQRRDPAGAIEAARKATESNPNSVSARLRYSQLLAMDNRLDEAMQELSTASKLDPHSAVVEGQMGELFFALGQTDSALRHLTLAVERDTSRVTPRITRALVLKQQGRLDEALDEIRSAAAIHPDHPLVQGTHGYLLGVAGRPAEATAVARQLEARARDGSAPGSIVAQVYAGIGDVDRTIQWLRGGETGGTPGGARDRDRWVLMSPNVHRTFDDLRADARFRAVFDSLDFRWPVTRGEGGRRGAPPDSARRGGTHEGGRNGR